MISSHQPVSRCLTTVIASWFLAVVPMVGGAQTLGGNIDPQGGHTETVPQLSLPLSSASSLLFDLDSGTIIHSRDPYRTIPPASLTKLFTMALVFRHIEATGLDPEETIDLPPSTWARNAPPRSSLMFLGQGQRATWRDLLAGLAVASGNDAAVAAAINVSGSVPAFVEAMNALARELGLERTVFVEPSGYSELNQSDAADLGRFVWWYVRTFPQSLGYHGMKEFTYPRPENLPPGADPVYGSIRQSNRNRLLFTHPEVSGLKTGYIDESGYNLAFVATRAGLRLAGIILGAPGEDERAMDATMLLEAGLETYASVGLRTPALPELPVWRGNRNRVGLAPVEVRTTLPQELLGKIRARLLLPDEIMGPREAGEAVGTVEWHVDGQVLASAPLRLAAEIAPPNPFYTFFEEIYLFLGRPFYRLPRDLSTSP